MANKKQFARGLYPGVLSVSKTNSIFLIALLLLLMPLFIKAQSVDNRYQSHLDRSGATYFFCPKKIGKNVNVNKFIYDMTYHTSNDSVILNFTILAKKPIRVKSFVLSCGDKNYMGGSVSTMYADIVGDKYEIRTTSKFSLDDICEVFSQGEALNFRMSLDNGGDASAAYSLSKWNKDSKMISRILDLIKFQR